MITASVMGAFEDIGDYLTHVWPIILVIVAVGGAARRGFRKAQEKRKVEEAAERVALVEDIKEQLRPVIEQLSNNGGSSMKDTLERMDEEQNEWIEKITIFMDQRTTDFAELNGHLDRLQFLTRSNQVKMQAVIASLHTAVYQVNADVEITYVNQAYCNLFELTFEEAMNGDWMSHVADEDRFKLENENNPAFTDHSPWTASYTIIGARTQERKLVTARALPLFDGDTFLGWVGSISTFHQDRNINPHQRREGDI